MPQEVGSSRVARWTVLLALSAGIPTQAVAACLNTYPESQVAERLAKEEYAACQYESMRSDYSKMLTEQVRLLRLLRPAYERRLTREFGKQALQVRLDDFDNSLKGLSTVADGIVEAVPTQDKGGAGKKAGGTPPLQGLLRKGKLESEALKSRIALAKDGLDSQETSTYCKLDFHFRLGDGLNVKMRKCWK